MIERIVVLADAVAAEQAHALAAPRPRATRRTAPATARSRYRCSSTVRRLTGRSPEVDPPHLVDRRGSLPARPRDDSTLVQYRDALRGREHDVHVVLGEEQREAALGRDAPQQLASSRASRRRHAGGRLVEQQQLGLPASAMPSSSCFWLPCDSAPPASSALSSRLTSRSSASASLRNRPSARDHRSRPRPRWAISAAWTFSNTVSPGKMLVRWNERPTPSAHSRCGAMPVTSRPSKAHAAGIGRRWPVMRLNSVDLPAPLGPMIATISGARRRGRRRRSRSRRRRRGEGRAPRASAPSQPRSPAAPR